MLRIHKLQAIGLDCNAVAARPVRNSWLPVSQPITVFTGGWLVAYNAWCITHKVLWVDIGQVRDGHQKCPHGKAIK
jgi:hypothetical protein